MRCLYCQNYPFSQLAEGTRYDAEGLAGILRELAQQGCHNWNLVSPTPWVPWILEALRILKQDGVGLPVVYNTSGYERVETVEAVAEAVSVFLPDLRYARAEAAAEGSDAADYVETARAALRRMWELAGPLQVDAQGVALRGTICRMLVLPGRADEAVANLRWMADNVGTDIALSLMAQYTPAFRAAGRPPWDRRVTWEEYEQVRRAAEELGFCSGWVQEHAGEPDASLIGYRMKPAGPGARDAL
jgi:putative pyruvate formate lyase activating enzyme